MPLPNDVVTFTLVGGQPNGYTDAAGNLAGIFEQAVLQPVSANGAPTQVLHPADGSTIVPAQIPITVGADGKWSVPGLAHTDDPNLQPFFYRLTAKNPPFRAMLKSNPLFAVPVAAGATVNYDLLTVATASTGVTVNLPSVISVNGHAGAVTLAASDVGADSSGAAAAAQAASLQKSANLSDLASASTARTNLGLGTAATQPSSAFDSSGAAAAAQAAAVAAIPSIPSMATIAADPALKAAYDPYGAAAGLALIFGA